jgi:hypothetical protein
LKAWTKEEALRTLKELVDEIDELRSSRVFSTEHVLWMTKCTDTLEEVFGPASRYYLSFVVIEWGQIPPGTPINHWTFGGNVKAALDAKHHEYFLPQLESAKGLLLGAANYLQERELSDVYSAKDTGPETSLILKILHLAEHQLRKVIRDQPQRESKVQNAFESLLIGADIPYGREVERIEYSSKTYTPDFSLPKISLVIEVKLCGRTEREKEIIAEINDDILAYQTKYTNLLFIVYDSGYIRDIDRFCSSFGEQGNVTIKVVKH